jgi:hypothetical protein
VTELCNFKFSLDKNQNSYSVASTACKERANLVIKDIPAVGERFKKGIRSIFENLEIH